MKKLKRIGITQRVDVIEGRSERRDALDQRWAPLLLELGAVAIPLANREALAQEYADALALDGVILSGGNDPVGAPGATGTAPERDAFERALFEACTQRLIPVLGVCRGAQVLNLFLGGKLSRVEGHVAVRHDVRLERPGTGSWGWPDRFEVNSFHSFGIRTADAAPGLEIVARAVPDDTVEAFQSISQGAAGIFWHPERETKLAEWDRLLLKRLFGLG